jgi:prophage DNA circulation protein
MGSMELNDIKYTSPSGKEFSFVFDNVSKETDLKTATFTFPEKDGAYVQSLGRGGRRFPLTCIFTGELCMQKADEFEAALEERGIGSLRHPVYGTRAVVPTGTIKREDGLVTEVNTSTVTVTFSETNTDKEILQSVTESSSDITAAAEVFVDNAIDEFAASISLTSAPEVLQVENLCKDSAKIICDNIDNFADMVATKKNFNLNDITNGAYKAMRKIVNSATAPINDIRGYAATVLKLMRLPATIVCMPGEIITAYANMVRDIVKKFKNDPFGEKKVRNQYAVMKLSLQGAICAICEGTTFACGQSSSSSAGGSSDGSQDGFSSREDAITAAEKVQEVFEAVKEKLDSEVGKDVLIETSESYSALLEVYQKTVALVLNTAFSLRKRRVIVLGRDRQIIELLAELYGDIDSHIDEFIIDNNLMLDELKVLPMGKEVAYYV